MNWFMKFLGRGDKQLQVGTRISVSGQTGVIVGGTLHVKFDKKPIFTHGDKFQPDTNKTRSFNLDAKDLEIL